MKPFLALCLAVGSLWSPLAQNRDEVELRRLFATSSWFELRDAIEGRNAASLYRGAVASAFNRASDAEAYLNRAIREASNAEAANEARETLANLYMRLGRSSDMLRVLDDALAAAPSRADIRNVRQAFEPFRGAPNQSVQVGRGQPFRCLVSANGVVLPVVVNGQSVEWLFDSAFSHSAMSESEARMLGISARGASVTAEDFQGGKTSTRTAVADRMQSAMLNCMTCPCSCSLIRSLPGTNRYRQTRHYRPSGGRCAAGDPLDTGRDLSTGSRPNSPRGVTRQPRVRWRDSLDSRAGVGQAARVCARHRQPGRHSAMGALRPRLSRDGDLGSKSTRQVRQIGGSTERRIVAIPELRLQVGGLDTVLQPANVFSRPVGNDFSMEILGWTC